ncbi:unnamed protein product [Calypogeia fissa]
MAYNIVEDLNTLKANISFGELLRTNAHLRKQMRSLVASKRRSYRLPPVQVNSCMRMESVDFGQPEISIQIQGCVLNKVPVDGGSSVNLMTQATAAELGFTQFQPTSRLLRMADQSRVTPVGMLRQVVTNIAGKDFELDYIIINPDSPSTFPILLGRPWLYSARVKVNWYAKQFAFGNPRIIVSWDEDAHLGETSVDEGYTSESTVTSSDEEEDTQVPRKKPRKQVEDVRFLDIFEFDDPEEGATIKWEDVEEPPLEPKAIPKLREDALE